MGRRVSQSNCQGLTSTWAALLKPWVAAKKPGELKRLAQLLGVEWPLKGDRAIIFRRAGDALRAISGVHDGQDASAALELWIQRHLVNAGPDLLITDAQRLNMLDRQRDAARRARDEERGQVARTIHMPAKVWSRLDEIQTALRLESREAALAAIIAGFRPKPIRVVQKKKGQAPGLIPLEEGFFALLQHPGPEGT